MSDPHILEALSGSELLKNFYDEYVSGLMSRRLEKELELHPDEFLARVQQQIRRTIIWSRNGELRGSYDVTNLLR